ncbi:hypothetical protein [Sulfitobacter sp.]|uniref:hypothetical protein n=1 Tax=Sulfitobacter sp. TaxID=1903071 RepID=UPI003EF33543
MLWRNDAIAAQTIRKRDMVFAAVGTMAFSVVLGVILILIGQLPHDFDSFWRHFTGFGGLFFLSPLLSWYGLIVGGTCFFFAVRKGFGGWLSTLLCGMALTGPLYYPFFSQDVHPVIIICFGGTTAIIFWALVKTRCRSSLIPPPLTRKAT